MKKVLFSLAIIGLLATGTTLASSIAVTGAAAQEGSYGLAVTTDATADNAYVEDQTPNNETVYRAQFLLRSDNVAFAAPCNNGPQTNHAIFKAWDDDQPAGTWRQHLVVGIRVGLSCQRLLNIKVTNNTTGGVIFKELSLPPAAAGWPVTVLVQFDQATDTYQLCRHRSDNPTFACVTTNIETGLANVDRIQLGMVGGADTTTTGTYYLDSFESYRTLTTP